MWVNALKTRQVWAEYGEYDSRQGIIIIPEIIFHHCFIEHTRLYQRIPKSWPLNSVSLQLMTKPSEVTIETGEWKHAMRSHLQLKSPLDGK